MAAFASKDRIALLDDFAPAQRERLLAVMTRRQLARGNALYTCGEPADALYLVCHGRLALTSGDGRPATMIGPGEVAGETAFFAGLGHNQTATAPRDSELLVLTRSAYEQALKEDQQLAAGFLRLTTRRLHRQAAPAATAERARTQVSTIAIVPAPRQDIPPEFFSRLRRVLERQGAAVIDRGIVSSRFGGLRGHDGPVVAWLNALERADKTVVLLTDGTMNHWTERCIRQADQVVFVGCGAAPEPWLTETERYAAALHPQEALRLVLVHPKRVGVVSGTRAWLDRLEVGLHHHVSLEDDIDLESLARFMTGTAIGFVAGGGGGLGSAHVGVYKAFREAGTTFDIFVGTSVGAAMTAGFSFLYEADGLTAGTHDIFVASRAFKRPTWPRYALLDHTAFDSALKRAYGAETRIEDCWRPFRAVATNLTKRRLELIGTGLLWKAVRASSAIPCVLPPVITEDGTVFVDGGVMDDAPLAPMKTLKAGPNVVVHFGKVAEQRLTCDYDAIPGRARLIASLLNPFAKLPRAPRPLGMLFRTMLAHQHYQLPAGTGDIVLTPPAPRGASVMISDDHLAKVSGYVTAAAGDGATIAAGGAGLPSSAGRYLDPTVVSGVRPDMAIAREEVFGPVLSVLTFESIEKALHIANDTPYGLSAGVWSRDVDTCMTIARGVRSGTVWVNTFMEGYPELPFGGYKQSGLGRELGKRAVEDYTEEKTIQFHRGLRTAWWAG